MGGENLCVFFSSVVRTEPHFVRNLCGAGDGTHGLYFSGRSVVLFYFAVGSGARNMHGVCFFHVKGIRRYSSKARWIQKIVGGNGRGGFDRRKAKDVPRFRAPRICAARTIR